jgi:hypothetical protein
MSGNMFEEVLKDAKAAEEKLLGPKYPYYEFIKAPSDLGMSDKGSLKVLGKNIDGLIEYVEVLVTGDSKASTTGQPLGNKFFLKSGGKCTDKNTGEEVDRYIYIDNVPAGNIPFISSGAGVNFSEFKGLIPGTISNLNAFNPLLMLQSFLSGPKPDCQELTMETIDVHNNKSTETHFVTLTDIRNMDPCIFQDRKNPENGKTCNETFSNMDMKLNNYEIINKNTSNDAFTNIYFISLGGLTMYIIYKTLVKMKLIPEIKDI